jgi:hypothetical protein
VARALLTTLKGLGFNDQLLGSEKCVLEKLQALDNDQTERIKQAFVKYDHPRFMKAFSYHLPFGAKREYRKEIARLNQEKLAHLIRICGFLMQTKVYLFWKKRIVRAR